MFLAPKADGSFADRSAFGGFWWEPIGGRTTSGVRVTGDGALALTAVWACVRNISEDIAKLPFKLYKPRKPTKDLPNPGKDVVTDHWLYRLFMVAPNNWQSPFEWREMLQGHIETRGNAYNQIIEDGKGGISQLIPMHPDRMKVELLPNGSFRYRFTNLQGTEVILTRDQVWHIRGFGSDGYVGYSPVQMQRQMLGVALSRQEYAGRFFANDAKPTGGWLETTARFANDAAKKTFRESWAKLQGGRNSGKMAVLEPGMKYHEVGFNNKDSQFIEASGMSVIECARMFRVPPHKVQDLSRASLNNIEQQNIEYATDCIQARCARWESSIKTQLLGEGSGLMVEIDINALMRGDMAARGVYINTGIINGSLLRNEAREMEGRNPIEGLDKPLVPLNMATIDADGEIETETPPEPTAVPAPPTEPKAPNETPADDKAARMQSLLKSNASRMARRIAKMDMPNAEVLADALAISQERASVWLGSLVSAESLEEGALAASLLRLALEVDT